MESKKVKKRNYVIIMLIIIIVGLIGYLFYDAFMKKNNENNTILENNVSGNNVIDADKLYSDYLKKLKVNLTNIYNEKDAEVSIGSDSDVWDNGYNFIITKDGRLLMNISEEEYKDKYNNYELSKNVLQMFLIETGNGGYKTLYFIKEDGTLNSFCIECISNGEVEVKTEKYKNIVNVVNTLFDLTYSGAYGPVFIDIEGNTYVY